MVVYIHIVICLVMHEGTGRVRRSVTFTEARADMGTPRGSWEGSNIQFKRRKWIYIGYSRNEVRLL